MKLAFHIFQTLKTVRAKYFVYIICLFFLKVVNCVSRILLFAVNLFYATNLTWKILFTLYFVVRMYKKSRIENVFSRTLLNRHCIWAADVCHPQVCDRKTTNFWKNIFWRWTRTECVHKHKEIFTWLKPNCFHNISNVRRGSNTTHKYFDQKQTWIIDWLWETDEFKDKCTTFFIQNNLYSTILYSRLQYGKEKNDLKFMEGKHSNAYKLNSFKAIINIRLE